MEFLALGILQYCYDGTYEGFDVYDAPDIRDKAKTVGIEVTEAITVKQARIQGEFVKYRLENNEEKKCVGSRSLKKMVQKLMSWD